MQTIEKSGNAGRNGFGVYVRCGTWGDANFQENSSKGLDDECY